MEEIGCVALIALSYRIRQKVNEKSVKRFESEMWKRGKVLSCRKLGLELRLGVALVVLLSPYSLKS